MTVSETPRQSQSGKSAPPGWYPDPLRFWSHYQDPAHGHQWRWWDGVSWSASVADGADSAGAREMPCSAPADGA